MKGKIPYVNLIIFIIIFMSSCQKDNNSITLCSPDKKIQMVLSVQDTLTYSVYYNGKCLVTPSKIAIVLGNGKTLGYGIKDYEVKRGTDFEDIDTPFYRQRHVSSKWNFMRIDFTDGWSLSVRAYDEGVAWRFETAFEDSTVIKDELAQFLFHGNPRAWVPYSKGKDLLANAYLSEYTSEQVSDFGSGSSLALLPLLVKMEDETNILICESDLRSYPGMFLEGIVGGYSAKFAHMPDSMYVTPTRSQIKVATRKDVIARTEGKRTYPWRIIAIAENDIELPINNLVYQLAEPRRYSDISWIKPGHAAWEWWNSYGLTDVNFKPGVNTATYKEYINFASRFNIPYVVIDEGWSDKDDIMKIKDEVNLKELIEYASLKNVGLIIWAVANVLDEKLEQACKYYSELGIKGFKVDFFDRDDQECVDMVYRIAESTGKHHLILDLHGIYKPTGLNRTFPHILNFEGVFGLEELKWQNPNMPFYDVTFPFIRQVVGPVDYTQGAYINASKEGFRIDYHKPMSQGTRAHQVASYIVYDSPLVMLCDSPSRYLSDIPCTEYIASIPTVFDHTIILYGKIGEYIVTAREKEGVWYIGGITNWDDRKITISLSFLQEGNKYLVSELSDSDDSSNSPEKYTIKQYEVDNTSEVVLNMAMGGGSALIIKKNK